MTGIHVIILGLCLVASFNQAAQIETKRYYHIQASDGALVTIGGDNSDGVKVVTEDSRGTDPRQTFWVGDGKSHEIMAQNQNALSNLVIAVHAKSKLVIQQTRGFIARRHQWWILHDLGDKKWSVLNAEIGECLTSNGKNKQLLVEVCDRTAANQTFIFTPVQTRRAASFPV